MVHIGHIGTHRTQSNFTIWRSKHTLSSRISISISLVLIWLFSYLAQTFSSLRFITKGTAVVLENASNQRAGALITCLPSWVIDLSLLLLFWRYSDVILLSPPGNRNDRICWECMKTPSYIAFVVSSASMLNRSAIFPSYRKAVSLRELQDLAERCCQMETLFLEPEDQFIKENTMWGIRPWKWFSWMFHKCSTGRWANFAASMLPKQGRGTFN